MGRLGLTIVSASNLTVRLFTSNKTQDTCHAKQIHSDKEPWLSENGVLTCRVVCVASQAADWNGQSDPYVKITYRPQNQVFRTEVRPTNSSLIRWRSREKPPLCRGGF